MRIIPIVQAMVVGEIQSIIPYQRDWQQEIILNQSKIEKRKTKIFCNSTLFK